MSDSTRLLLWSTRTWWNAVFQHQLAVRHLHPYEVALITRLRTCPSHSVIRGQDSASDRALLLPNTAACADLAAWSLLLPRRTCTQIP